MMYEPKKSDSPIVARKSANKVGRPTAEPMERRGGAKRTRISKTRGGHRAEKACQVRWTVYAKQQRQTGNAGSQRCSIT